MTTYTLTEAGYDTAEGAGLVPSSHTIHPDTIESYVGSWLIAHAAQRDEVRIRRTCSTDTITWVANVEDDMGEVRCRGFLTLSGPGVDRMV